VAYRHDRCRGGRRHRHPVRPLRLRLLIRAGLYCHGTPPSRGLFSAWGFLRRSPPPDVQGQGLRDGLTDASGAVEGEALRGL
jgi:hypothetical protein